MRFPVPIPVVPYLLFVSVHILASFTLPGRIWGAHHAGFLKPSFLALWIILAAATLIPWWRRFLVRMAGGISSLLQGSRWIPIVLIMAAATFFFLTLRTNNSFLGDSLLLSTVVMNPESATFGTAGVGSLWIHKILYRAGSSLFGWEGGTWPFILTSVSAGLAMLFLAARLAALLTTGARARTVLFVSLAGWAGLLFSFGYVEHYPLMQATLFFYLYGSIRSLRGAWPIWIPAVTLVAASLLHLSAVALAPSWLIVAAPSISRSRAARGAMIGGAILVAILGAWALLNYMEEFYRGADAFVPFLHQGSHSYPMVSVHHLLFIGNELFLILGGALLLPFMDVRQESPSAESASDSPRSVTPFLAVSTGLALIYLILVDPMLGPRDWDLMALFGAPMILLIGSYLFRGTREPGTAASGMIIGAILVHTLPWILVNADQDRSVEMTLAMVVDDPHYANPAARAPKSMGVILSRAGYHEAAAELFRTAAENQGDDPQNLFNLGTNSARRGKYDQAISYLRRAIEAEPRYEDAYLNLATAELKAGNLVDAEKTLRSLLSIAPDQAKAHYQLGTLLGGQGRADEAINSLRECVRIAPEHVEGWANLGVMQARLGQTKEARVSFKEALSLEPENENLRGYLDRLGPE